MFIVKIPELDKEREVETRIPLVLMRQTISRPKVHSVINFSIVTEPSVFFCPCSVNQINALAI